ncbi:hypothetical protein LC607_16250 [Nostoc sp. CHAB 5824]|nr:hypothetical protein [Nostoc sp. CHAB 5824]
MDSNAHNSHQSFGKSQIIAPASYEVTQQLSENAILTTLSDKSCLK